MIETYRLIIRPFRIEDASNAFEWLGDDEVMKYIPGGPDPNTEVCQNRIARYIDFYNTNGYSKYAVIEKNSNKLIGDCGIMKIEDLEMVELGYRIAKSYWQKGYAIEASQAVLKYAFEVLDFKEIYAIVESGNAISKHIIKDKLGFIYQKNAIHYGIEMEVYKMIKKDFKTLYEL